MTLPMGPVPASAGAGSPSRRQPSRAARKRVKAAFDPATLADICVRQSFDDYAPRTNLAPGHDGHPRFYHHLDQGSPILAVAHLDSVQPDGRCTVTDTAAGLLACSGTLDDRLGAYIILDLLPKLGVVTDILLTTDEECGASTASAFDPTAQYNWMIQFDRAGTDVVAYQYDDDHLRELVDGCGARMGIGSYSDIADLDHLGCVGLNWGCGYADYHSARAHAWLEDTFRMVARFVKFHRANVDTYLPYSWKDSWVDYAHVAPSGPGEFIAGDCGHEVDLADPATYVLEAGKWYMCRRCAFFAA